MTPVLNIEDFTPLQGESLRARTEAGELQLELAEVLALGKPPDDNSRAPFSLLFKASAATPIEQGLLDLEHPTLGKIEIFVVPIGEHEDRRSYEAVFA